jgi:hypothetical protein
MAEKQTLPQNVMLCDRQRAQVLIKEFSPAVNTLGTLKRGDWIRALVEWQQSGEVRCEFLSCLVSQVTPSGLVKVRVLSKPDYTLNHSLKYGDDLTLSMQHIVVHDPMPTMAFDAKGNEYALTPDQLEQNIKTLLGAPAEAIPPSPGRQYWTRNGATAVIWTILQDEQGRFFIGEVGGIRDVQWFTDGKHRHGNPDLDIVKDPTASELVQD